MRKANHNDINRLELMLKEFYDATGYLMSYDSSKVKRLLKELIDHHIVIVNDDVSACIGGLLYEYMFNTELTLQEVFWWVSPRNREKGIGKDLITQFELEGKKRGAKSIHMIALSSLGIKVQDMYLANGYMKSEEYFIKGL